MTKDSSSQLIGGLLVGTAAVARSRELAKQSEGTASKASSLALRFVANRRRQSFVADFDDAS